MPTPKESAEQSVTPEVTPEVVQAQPKKKSLALGMDAANWALIVVGLVILAGGVYDARQALAGVSTVISVSATPTPIPQPSLAPLVLNKAHQRQGVPIEVDPDVIGRPNPFAH